MPETSRLNPFAVRGGAVTVSAAFARELAERMHTTAKAARLCSMRDHAAWARPSQVINDSKRFAVALRAQTNSLGSRIRDAPPIRTRCAAAARLDRALQRRRSQPPALSPGPGATDPRAPR